MAPPPTVPLPPILPERGTPRSVDAWRQAVRAFHTTGDPEGPSADPLAGEPLIPWAQPPEISTAAEAQHYPVVWEETRVSLGPHTLLELVDLADLQARRRRVLAFREQLQELSRGLQDRLRIDANLGEEARTPGALSAALADPVQLDMEALTRQLPTPRGSRRLAPERAQRMRWCADLIQAYLADADRDALQLLGPQEQLAELPPGLVATASAAPLEAAAEVFESHAAGFVELQRAVRMARLEVADAWRPAHAEALARLDWQALGADELSMMPPVVVLEAAQRVRAGALALYADLLHGDRPLNLVLTDEVGSPQASHSLGTLALADGQAHVVQSTLARPAHLLQGLEDGLVCLRPTVAVVAVPDWKQPIPAWVQLAVALLSRRSPCFRCDPESGEAGSQPFDLGVNPEAQGPWPQVEVTHRTSDGIATGRLESFTPAHGVCLLPAWRDAFRVVPTTAWSAEQVDLAAWLKMRHEDRLLRIPYVWVHHGDRLARALITRQLAFACITHQEAWRRLQSMGGALAEEEPVETEVGDTEPVSEATAVDDSDSGGAVAVARLVQALLGSNGTPVVVVPSASGGTTDDVAPDSADPEARAEPPAATELVGEPSIDSPLCTTCHDCINLNSRLFQYDDNKQAYIADPAAGSFVELVKAAEACPARCIYPGAPRSGDKTVTHRLLERALKFA